LTLTPKGKERRETSLRSATGKDKIKWVNEKSHTEHPGKALEPPSG